MTKNSKALFVAGLILLTALLLPCALLRERGIFTYHDQLDGEVIAYMLQAKHLGDGAVLPEFMGGASRTALIPPAVGYVLLFRLVRPYTALLLMQLVGSLAGYVGMYLLVRRLAAHDTAAFVAGMLYGMLPFLPVYGLSQFGLPLLGWCVLQVQDGTDGRRRRIAYLYSVVYALFSSLVLVGFAVLAALGVYMMGVLLRERHAGKRKAWPVFFLWLLVLGTYCLTNRALFLQLSSSGGDAISHKAEYVLAAEPVGSAFLEGFLHGGQHSADWHGGICLLILVVLLDAGVRRLRGKGSWEPAHGVIVRCVLWNAGFAWIGALWNSAGVVSLRGQLGAVGAFQMERFLWLAPCLWYLAFGCCAAIIWRQKALWGRLQLVAAVVIAAGTGLFLMKNSDVKANVQKLRNPNYGVMSYSDYYAIGVLDQVEAYLAETTGKEQAAYRVVSLGIDPAAALYHGFYCLDGYSNNYALSYKHAFRRVIAPALEQSDYLRAYFDDWGNRCYIFGTECPGYYTIEKNGFYFQHLEMNTEALRALGGDYLFSAAYIANSEELGLVAVREEPFETQESYYRIYVYAVPKE